MRSYIDFSFCISVLSKEFPLFCDTPSSGNFMKKRKCRFAFVGNRFPITGFSGVHFRINSYGTSASFQVKISDSFIRIRDSQFSVLRGMRISGSGWSPLSCLALERLLVLCPLQATGAAFGLERLFRFFDQAFECRFVATTLCAPSFARNRHIS